MTEREHRAIAIAEAERTKKLLDLAEANGLSLLFAKVEPHRPGFFAEIAGLKPPAFLILADIGDHNESFGPPGFDQVSLCFLRTAAGKVVINSSGADSKWYAVAITAAFYVESISVLVETTERHAADWLDFFEQRGEPIAILNIISGEGGHA
jgi:hypothetical protein